ncbi:MFS transporter [Desulfofalx alkaliphila]|uniref:MFS transporter n=1 Tax=Desulfofalx alkaliphila TaxID=105483 RepID=UPI0005529823|nr:MFS transporter [Desulfofalx alkaliphila]
MQTEKTYSKWLVLFNVGLGTLMSTLSAGVTNTALPFIAAEFEVQLEITQWVVSAYMLVIASLLPIFGKIADVSGRKKIYSTGLLIFSIGSILCGFATSALMLILFRVIQALGSAMTMANTLAIVASVFPENERGKAMGISNTVVAVGTLAGPGIGGLLIDLFGWRSVFWFVVPFGIAAYIISFKILPELKSEKAEAEIKFDGTGALFFTLAMLLFILGVSNANEYSWNKYVIAAIILSVVFAVLFVFNEKRHASPLIDLSLFQNRMLVGGILANFFSFVGLISINFLMPFYLQEVLVLSASEMGIMLTAIPLAMGITAPFAGRISDRIQPVYIATFGLVVSLLGQLSLLGLGLYSLKADIYLRLFIVGVGRGIFQAPNNSAIMGSVAEHRFGVVGSLISLARNVASVLGIALTVAIFSNVYAAKLASREISSTLVERQIFIESFQVVMAITSILLVCGIIASLFRNKK